MINNILILIIGMMLLWAGIIDIKRLRISRAFIIVFFIVCLCALATGKSPNIMAAISGAAIGLCAIGISMLSGEQIGRGDGMVITAIGLVAGFRGCLVVVCIAAVVMSFIAILMLILKKGNRKTKLPFIPAVFAGYIFWVISTCSLIGGVFI
jgi:leader peptidase (prepilin peptidase)/N-methyltransferase